MPYIRARMVLTDGTRASMGVHGVGRMLGVECWCVELLYAERTRGSSGSLSGCVR
jgi:hypothetical protein